MINNLVQFNNHNLEIINKNGQRYFSAPQIGAALGYARSDKIVQIYNRHNDEFTPDMSDTLKLRLSGNLETDVRIFSLRGCHLLAMFSKTPVAKKFRRWILDLIEQQNQSVTNCRQLDTVAIRDELEKIFDKCLTSDLHIRGEVSDSDLMLCLHHWFATRQKKVFDNLRELTRENESLKTKLLTIKQALK